jgi:uroporphyrinogen decarboxylase
MSSPDELDDYPFPDYTEPYRFEGVEERIEQLHAAGYFVGGGGVSLFERAWYLRGMEQMFIDWAVNPDFANKLLDKITQVGIERITLMVSAGVDSFGVGGDVGTQRAMMISPTAWRKWIKPRTAKMIDVARSINPNVFATFHSDGYIEPIIPDLIEIGVNVVNPIQPECMDPVEIKRKYGDRITLSGTIGTQTTMPFATPDEVRQVVKERIETLAQGGGLILGPTHDFEPEVPWENIVALYEAIEEYGRYD